jgi:hypothetical protein
MIAWRGNLMGQLWQLIAPFVSQPAEQVIVVGDDRVLACKVSTGICEKVRIAPCSLSDKEQRHS